jgi:hypothetical protein
VTALHRLFGDADGNRTVDIIDLTLFRNLFGTITTDPTSTATASSPPPTSSPSAPTSGSSSNDTVWGWSNR